MGHTNYRKPPSHLGFTPSPNSNPSNLFSIFFYYLRILFSVFFVYTLPQSPDPLDQSLSTQFFVLKKSRPIDAAQMLREMIFWSMVGPRKNVFHS